MAKEIENPYMLLDPKITGIDIPKSTKGAAGLKMIARLMFSKTNMSNIKPEQPSKIKPLDENYERM